MANLVEERQKVMGNYISMKIHTIFTKDVLKIIYKMMKVGKNTRKIFTMLVDLKMESNKVRDILRRKKQIKH